MFRTSAALLMMSTALAAGPALAQSAMTAPVAASTTGGVVSQQGTGEFRASKFSGLDIYGSENQKVGDIKEILIDGTGQAKTIVIGVGGFLGLGEKNVAVSWSAVEWKLERPATTASTAPAMGTTGGGTATGSMGATPTTTASTAPARSPAEQAAYNGYPDHGMIKMTKADLQNAPDFKYYSDTTSSSGSTTTNATVRP